MSGDWRLSASVGIAVLALLLGVAISALPGRSVEIPPGVQEVAAGRPVAPAYAGEVHERFQQAAVMLHAGQYLFALEALEWVVELAPRMPEAHVNAGFALLGLGEPQRAAGEFRLAIDLRPRQLNAYYGLAVALEGLGDLDGALGAMRSYVHLAEAGDPFVRRAWAAIWEWEQARNAAAGGTDADTVHAAAVDAGGGR